MDPRLERLRWRSRRGLLELDIVFERFWSSAAASVDAKDAEALERLLAMADNDLLDLVMGRRETPEAHLRKMVAVLRAV